MNLRDKLRTQGEEPQGGEDVEATSDWSDLTVEPESPYAKIKSAPKAAATKAKTSAAAMPKLDVNRRFLVLAGAAAFMTACMGVMYINNSGKGLSEAGTKIEVVALAADVERGAKLTEDRLTTVAMPKAYLPKGYIPVGEDGEGMKKAMDSVAIAPMVEGEPLIEARISPPNKKLGIAYLLKGGERAKTVKVDSASGLAGLIKPGNEVDLIATITDPNNEQRRIGTPVIQKARVIAVGDHLLGEILSSEEEEAADESGGIESESTVTLAVPGSKINIVTLLEDLGNLKIVLRAEGDDSLQKSAFTDDVIMALVSGRVPPKQVARPVERPVQDYVPPRTVIRTISRPVSAPYNPPPPRYVAQPRPRPVAAKPRPVAKPPAPKPKPATNSMPNIIRFGGGGE